MNKIISAIINLAIFLIYITLLIIGVIYLSVSGLPQPIVLLLSVFLPGALIYVLITLIQKVITYVIKKNKPYV
jgi:RsiW-degrading membrane proteinase PrsW (M82 family)